MNRRVLLSASAAVLAAALTPATARQAIRPRPTGGFGLDAASLGVRAGEGDATASLQRALGLAASAGQPLFLAPGRYAVSGLVWPNGAQLVGAPGATRLVAARPGPLLAGRGLARAALTGLILDGAGLPLAQDLALAAFEAVRRVEIVDCDMVDGGGTGLLLTGCGGTVRGCRIERQRETGIRSLDATGLAILDNVVERCGNNGVQVWRGAKGDDGTIVRSNRILDIRADRGGDGPYGNGISLFRAGGVVVEGNVIRRCAFSAVRDNGGTNTTIAGNNCAALGETAIFAEFAFDGAVVAGNLVDGCTSGIQMVNFADSGGRVAACTGNVIRNVRATSDPRNQGLESGIKVEGDAAVTGNVVDGAASLGIQVGWGPSLRDCTVASNTVRGAPIGIGVSVAPGAGRATVVGNTIAGAARGAVVGMEWRRIATGDLARDARHPGLTVASNGIS